MAYEAPRTDQLELGLQLKKEYNIAERRAHDELLGLPPLSATWRRSAAAGRVHEYS